MKATQAFENIPKHSVICRLLCWNSHATTKIKGYVVFGGIDYHNLTTIDS